jgi:DNA-binding NarL/FixJ family response regulator
VIRVLVVDDQALVRGGFRMILDAQKDIEVVAEAEDGREALAKARALTPDVVLMDIRMPELDGLEATRRLLAGDGRSRVLILTTFDADEYVYEAMKAGASGFLLKDVRPEHSRMPSGRSRPATPSWPRRSRAASSSSSSAAHHRAPRNRRSSRS